MRFKSLEFLDSLGLGLPGPVLRVARHPAGDLFGARKIISPGVLKSQPLVLRVNHLVTNLAYNLGILDMSIPLQESLLDTLMFTLIWFGDICIEQENH